MPPTQTRNNTLDTAASLLAYRPPDGVTAEIRIVPRPGDARVFLELKAEVEEGVQSLTDSIEVTSPPTRVEATIIHNAAVQLLERAWDRAGRASLAEFTGVGADC